ncbi:PREDICTED: protein ECERIFERUM 26-like isoform X2 [Tarenaya hassleriana]|uniref:protein ECERIFERUM 26-like isoform X1 n=1 Tax=Tarenaya hassleriana TaxID=28532 RepID=UPI00053C2EBC|nr:PREDICTED: protein ECERIFERUM 26-like isoform X1 [Tarenaya hassleriana]XP_010546596.1 PREDICTED: protein ECERIFERUM 26-like isoform X2 [Tarenaya hassleriana]
MEDTRKSRRVEINGILTAVSSKPTGPGRIHPLTDIDHAMDQHTVHVIFYYRRSPFSSFDLDSVRVSLSELLSFYPPVTGRVARNPETRKWEVKCNDAGVRILKARVGVGLDEWLRSADGNEERDLTVWEAMPEDPSIWSPFRIQINEFEGGGAAIGLSCSHKQADPTSLIFLFKSWTEAQRRQPISHPPSFSPLINTNAVNSPSLETPTTATATATATFRFSAYAFRRCLEESVAGIFPDASPFDVFAALFSSRIANAKRDHSRNRSSVTICVDIRRLLPDPVPYGFFGNALHFSSLELSHTDDTRIGHVARMINRHVANLDGDQILSGLKRLGPEAVQMYGSDLTVVSMEHMVVEGEPSMYEAVFDGGERPSHVSCMIGNSGREGVIVVTPSPEKGFGRTVTVTLPEEETKKLLVDQEILRFEPEIILSGGVNF